MMRKHLKNCLDKATSATINLLLLCNVLWMSSCSGGNPPPTTTIIKKDQSEEITKLLEENDKLRTKVKEAAKLAEKILEDKIAYSKMLNQNNASQATEINQLQQRYAELQQILEKSNQQNNRQQEAYEQQIEKANQFTAKQQEAINARHQQQMAELFTKIKDRDDVIIQALSNAKLLTLKWNIYTNTIQSKYNLSSEKPLLDEISKLLNQSKQDIAQWLDKSTKTQTKQ